MRRILYLLGAILLAAFAWFGARQGGAQEKPAAEPQMTPEDVAKKNPVAPTPEGLAEAKKLFGYHCAMCHGKDGDGKGDLAVEMKLELHDWRDASSIAKVTDGEMFWIITNGRGKMLGGGDRTTEKLRWNLVNLVHSFGKKDASDKPKTEAPKS